jgi:hypothetical protein
MAVTVRAAANVAHKPSRNIPGGLSANAAPPNLNDVNLALGRTGTDDCILTIGLSNSIGGGPYYINVYYWCAILKEWLKAGANDSFYQKAFEAGGTDVYLLPENSFWWAGVATGGAIAAGKAVSDGFDFTPNTVDGLS